MTDQFKYAVDFVWRNLPELPAKKEVETLVVREVTEMLPQQGRIFLRLAGLSGAAAVMLGAYGAHGQYITISFLSLTSQSQTNFPAHFP